MLGNLCSILDETALATRLTKAWPPGQKVRDLANYRWSSYRLHGLGEPDELLSPVPGWEALGRTEAARQKYWRQWLHRPLSEKDLAALRRCVTTGRPFGEAAWAEAMARRLGINLLPRARGRPRKKKMN